MAELEDGRLEQLLDKVTQMQRDLEGLRKMVLILLTIALLPILLALLQVSTVLF